MMLAEILSLGTFSGLQILMKKITVRCERCFKFTRILATVNIYYFGRLKIFQLSQRAVSKQTKGGYKVIRKKEKKLVFDLPKV